MASRPNRPPLESRLAALPADLANSLLPTAVLRRRYLSETQDAPYAVARGITDYGLPVGLALLPPPPEWWLTSSFPSVVQDYVALGPPDPETFADRLLTEPWELSDARAQFVCD